MSFSLENPPIFVKLRRRVLPPPRLILKLEYFRGNRIADWIRRRIIAMQPGLEQLPPFLRTSRDFILWVPPDWNLSGAEQARLHKLLRIRQVRANAQIVSCDDWVISRNGDRLKWREKSQFDVFLDQQTGFADGPLLLAKSLVEAFGLPPNDAGSRCQWRAMVMKEHGPSAWAHVPLPLAVCPDFSHEIAKPRVPHTAKLVSILIPSGGFLKVINGRKTKLIRNCLMTLLQRSEYRNIEVILVDGGEFSERELTDFAHLVESSLGPNRFIHCRDERSYSYSLRMNLAASYASGDYLLQLNDDTELLEPKAIGSMVAMLEDSRVGVVGGLLLYPTGRVQHAGVVLDNVAPCHPWSAFWPKRLPVGLLTGARQFQSVTGAVCMCRSEIWNSLNGLVEELPINYGDVDFCLRARELGFMVIFDPASRWIHFESASRSLSKVPAELPHFRKLWSEKLGGERCIDPFSSRWRELRRASCK